MAKRLAVDIGGTFVDAIIYDTSNGELRLEKDFTTPEKEIKRALRLI